MHVDIWWNMWLLLNKTAKCLYLLVTLIANMFLIYFDDRKLKSSFCPIVHYNRHVVIGYLHSYRWPLLWHYIPEQYPFQKLLLWHIVKVRTRKMKMLQMPPTLWNQFILLRSCLIPRCSKYHLNASILPVIFTDNKVWFN